MRSSNSPRVLTAQPANSPSTEPSTTSNTSLPEKTDAPEHNLHLNRPLQWVSQGVKRYEKRNQEQPLWMETLPVALNSCCTGERGGKGFLVRGQYCCSSYGGYAFPRACFNGEHKTHNFHSSLSPSTRWEFFTFSGKTPPQNTTNQLLTNDGSFQQGPLPWRAAINTDVNQPFLGS